MGFPKCGQISMQEYLQTRFAGMPSRNEIPWKYTAVAEFTTMYIKRAHPDFYYQPMFIIRDPVERCWSAFMYLGRSERFETYFDYMQNQNYYNSFGVANPIIQSNYSRWLKPWQHLNPVMIWMEDMQKNPNFPHLNKTSKERDGYTEFPQNYKKVTQELLDLDAQGKFWTNGYRTLEEYKAGEPSLQALKIIERLRN